MLVSGKFEIWMEKLFIENSPEFPSIEHRIYYIGYYQSPQKGERGIESSMRLPPPTLSCLASGDDRKICFKSSFETYNEMEEIKKNENFSPFRVRCAPRK